ncbi:MAG: NusG domain II-containing protein [Coriobacteriia bacterium]|nr:NusG domain II-containing protein [Coriobacteriia bacterium]
MTRADRIVIAVIAVVAVVSWPVVVSAGAADATRVAIAGPGGVTTRNLDSNEELAIVGARGEVVVRIADGAVAVTEADCPDHTCVRTGRISAPGSVIACVPNGVIVRIEGGGLDELDARVR